MLGATGLLIWANESTSRILSGRVLTVACLIHGFEAFLALLHVGVVHRVKVSLSPGAFPFSKAMWTGESTAPELAEAHAAWLDEAEARAAGTADGISK